MNNFKGPHLDLGLLRVAMMLAVAWPRWGSMYLKAFWGFAW